MVRSYLGLNQPRLEGDEFLQVVDEFVAAAKARWPKVLIQVCACVLCFVFVLLAPRSFWIQVYRCCAGRVCFLAQGLDLGVLRFVFCQVAAVRSKVSFRVCMCLW